jgi:transcriptional regulator with XRE-family HTH domain
MNTNGLGTRVQRYRKRKGWAVQRLADATDGKISRATIVNIESGRRAVPTVDVVVALAEALDVPMLSLIYDVEAPWAPADYGHGSNLEAARAAEVYSRSSGGACFSPTIRRFFDLLGSTEHAITRYRYNNKTLAKTNGAGTAYVTHGTLLTSAQRVIDDARQLEILLAVDSETNRHKVLQDLPADILQRVRKIPPIVVSIISRFDGDIDYGQFDPSAGVAISGRPLNPKTGTLQYVDLDLSDEA